MMKSLVFPLCTGTWLWASLTASAQVTPPIGSTEDVVVFSVNETTNTPYAVDLALQSHSEMLIRGWFKWNQAPSLDTSIPKQIHAQGELFGGGITCSVLFEAENGLSKSQALDMATRTADGQLLLWPTKDAIPRAYHGTLSNPAYLDYLFRWCREQIDAGVDSLFFDEHNAALLPTEGYDDYSLSDFRTFLLDVYEPTRNWESRDSRWETQFEIDLKNSRISASGEMTTFDYRGYLGDKNLFQSPTDAANPLAAAWKAFKVWRDDRAWNTLTSRTHSYAQEKGRKVSITVNGLAPYVDFQTPNNWEEDEQIERTGHIDLSQSRLARWRSVVVAGQAVAKKKVPVVFFHDWGGTLPWQAAPASERNIWMRTRGAEIYAAGGFFAFPVLEPHGYDAGKDGTLKTIAQQADFYKSHRDLYLKGHYLGAAALQSETPDLSFAVWSAEDPQTIIVHLINRRFIGNQLEKRPKVDFRIPLDRLPQFAVAFSPDWEGKRSVKCVQTKKDVSISLQDLEAYAIVVLRYDKPINLSKLQFPAQ